METKNQIKQLRNILDALAKAEDYDNDLKEIVFDKEISKINNISKNNILDNLLVAIGNNVKRKKTSVFIYSELFETPNIDEIYLDLLMSTDSQSRCNIIQTIGLRKIEKFVGK